MAVSNFSLVAASASESTGESGSIVCSELSGDKRYYFCATDDYVVKAYSIEHLAEKNGLMTTLKGHQGRIRSLHSLKSVPGGHVLFTCAEDGFSYIYDLRQGTQPTLSFFITDPNFKKSRKHKDDDQMNLNGRIPLTSMDVGFNGAILALGTEGLMYPVDGESEQVGLISFFDVRYPDIPLNIFSSSHSDTITDLKFNPFNNREIYSTGSDGLICLFDISQPNEDDALISVVNIEESIEKVCLFGPKRQCAAAVTSSGNRISLQQMQTAQEMGNLTSSPDGKNEILSIEYFESPTQQKLYSLEANENNLQVHELSLKTKELVSQTKISKTQERIVAWDISCGHVIGWDLNLATPKHIISGGSNGIINLWSP